MSSTPELLQKYDLLFEKHCQNFRYMMKLEEEEAPYYIGRDAIAHQIHLLYALVVDCFEVDEFDRYCMVMHLNHQTAPSEIFDSTVMFQKKPIMLLPYIVKTFPRVITKFQGFEGKTAKLHIDKIEELIDVFKLEFYEAEEIFRRYLIHRIQF